MNEFLEFCRERSESDGLYAIAYAIMLSNSKVSAKLGTVVRRTSGLSPKATNPILDFDDTRKQIKEWLAETERVRFCLLDIWVSALGRSDKNYSMLDAKQLAKILGTIDGCEQGTKQIFDRWGQQRGYTFTPQSDDLDI